MKKKTLIIIISIFTALALISGAVIFAFRDLLFPEDVQTGTIDISALTIDLGGKYYIGTESYTEDASPINSFALSKLYPDNPETTEYSSLTPAVATVEAGVLTVISEGEFTLRVYKDGGVSDIALTSVAGVNTFSDLDFMYAFNAMKGVIMHSDVILIDTKSAPYNVGFLGGGNKYGVYGNMYGNGHRIDCSPVIGDDSKPYFDPAFKLRASGVTIQDVYFTGYVLTENESLDLSELTDKGVLFDSEGTESFANPSASVVNCIFENANRLMNFISSTVLVRDCVLRNAGEACIAIGTYSSGGSEITIRDTAMGLTGSAAVVVYKDGEVSANKAIINLEGEVDIYNWKKVTEIQLIPSYEFISFQNANIREDLAETDAEYFENDTDENKCLHLGILVLVGGDARPVINGAEEAGLQMASIPLPSSVQAFLDTCDFYGYWGDDMRIAP